VTGRRGLLTCVAAIGVGGAVVLLAAGRTWGSATVAAATGNRQHVSVSGHDVLPSLTALGIALLVLAVAVVAARGRLRSLVGLVVVVVAGALLAAAATSADDVAAALRSHAFAVTDPIPASTSGWAVLVAVAAAVAAAAGAVTVLRGPAWPALGSRYDAPAARPDGETSAWEALDRGDDPTV
jgi:hypothetical protein